MNHLSLHGLDFELRRSSRRRSLTITVERDGALLLSAPPDCGSDVMAQFVHDKLEWIYGKLVLKGMLGQSGPEKRYVSGESFPYLGRNFRLLLVDQQDVPFKLVAGRFQLLRAEQARARQHVIAWYSAHGKPWLAQRVARFAPRVGVEPSGVHVQDLGYRWGSCGKSRRLNFHWRTVLLPPPIIEYVVVHELVHLHEPHHTPAFWQRVERLMPDFEARKTWLAERAGALVGV